MAGLNGMGTKGQQGTRPFLSPASAILTGDRTGGTADKPPQLSPSEDDAFFALRAGLQSFEFYVCASSRPRV